jgi:hypothetical protein
MQLWRQIHCPICGAELRVEVANGGQFPEVHVLPSHTPAKAVNLCIAARVTVTIDHHKCVECGADCMATDSGLCLKCWKKLEAATAHSRNRR